MFSIFFFSLSNTFGPPPSPLFWGRVRPSDLSYYTHLYTYNTVWLSGFVISGEWRANKREKQCLRSYTCGWEGPGTDEREKEKNDSIGVCQHKRPAIKLGSENTQRDRHTDVERCCTRTEIYPPVRRVCVCVCVVLTLFELDFW